MVNHRTIITTFKSESLSFSSFTRNKHIIDLLQLDPFSLARYFQIELDVDKCTQMFCCQPIPSLTMYLETNKKRNGSASINIGRLHKQSRFQL
jgi:hypothetical protein